LQGQGFVGSSGVESFSSGDDSCTWAEVVAGKRKRSRSRGKRGGAGVKRSRLPSAYGPIVSAAFEDLAAGRLGDAQVKVTVLGQMSEMEDFIPDLSGEEVVQIVEEVVRDGGGVHDLRLVFEEGAFHVEAPVMLVDEIDDVEGSSLYEVD